MIAVGPDKLRAIARWLPRHPRAHSSTTPDSAEFASAAVRSPDCLVQQLIWRSDRFVSGYADNQRQVGQFARRARRRTGASWDVPRVRGASSSPTSTTATHHFSGAQAERSSKRLATQRSGVTLRSRGRRGSMLRPLDRQLERAACAQARAGDPVERPKRFEVAVPAGVE